MKTKTSQMTKRLLFNLIGFALCICPPALCILHYFPVWIAEGGECVVSGVTLILLAIAVLPLYKFIKRALRSAASYTVWLVGFIIFLLLSEIAHEMTVICFFGFIGNLLGALAFYLGQRCGKREEPDYEM